MTTPSLYPRTLATLLLLALTSFGFVRAGDLAEITPLTPEESAHINASARGLAGLTADGDAPWESTITWKNYTQRIGEHWAYLDKVRLGAMRSWAGSELGGLDSRVVFYPFSGPDFIYADTLFPNSKILLMAGLEPIGSVPDLAKLQDSGKLPAYLGQVEASLNTILAASFFKTKDMKSDFNNDLVDGLLPVLNVFIVRQGFTINSVQYVSLESDGTLHPRPSKAGANGVQITYDGDRAVLYFETDLGNDGLKSNPGYINLMRKFGPGVTYLKAASYLLYEDYFSSIRNAILENSTGVVEDDSGIPFKDFKPSLWDVEPFGNYTGPIGLFHEHYQPDLTDYYAKTPHSSLTFGSGYKFVPSVSSLLVAKKKS